MLSSPNRVSIDLSALAQNLCQVRSLVGKGTRIMGVVKSDAYGHGLLPVAASLERNGVDALGVAHVDEGVALRVGGVRSPIVVLSGIRTREEAQGIITHDLTPVVVDLEAALTLAQECERAGKRGRIHVKVDTGMGRLGIPWDQIGPFLDRVLSLESLEVQALISHLAAAEEADPGYTESQIARFETAIATGRALGLDLSLNSIANSAGIMGHPGSHFDMVRPGIMLYGGLPSPAYLSKVPLRPVMGFQARVVQVRYLPDKTPVSYGRTYWTQGPRVIAYVSAGYGDGLPRALSNRGKVLIGGNKAPIVGTVCMNLTACDITGFPAVDPGDEAVLLGCQGGECITGDDMARDAGTISYEIFCAIGRKNTRNYIG